MGAKLMQILIVQYPSTHDDSHTKQQWEMTLRLRSTTDIRTIHPEGAGVPHNNQL